MYVFNNNRIKDEELGSKLYFSPPVASAAGSVHSKFLRVGVFVFGSGCEMFGQKRLKPACSATETS